MSTVIKHKYFLPVTLAVVSLFMVLYASYVGFFDRGYNEVSFIDVGEGDSAFIKTRHHKTMLIDGGNTGSGENTIIPYLRSKFTDRIDAVFISHMHDDHVIGIIEMIENEFPISKIYISKNADKKSELTRTADKYGIPLIELTKGDMICIDNTVFTVIADRSEFESDDENDNSMILKMDCGENSFLFTGDAEAEYEAELLNSDIDVDFLKVAHHGSDTSSSEEFVQKVSPKLAIISVGEFNFYGHPSAKTIETFKKLDIPVLRTDIGGTVTITMDERDIKNIETSEDKE